jgi:hypothetical protein
MNCTQVEELLPLYAGHDLAERSERLVTAHLRSCAACALTLEDYRDLRKAMPDFAPPNFPDEVYAEIRRGVWQQIEGQSRRRSPFASIAVWFKPQFVWAAAAVLMIGFSIVGRYFINQAYDFRPTVVVDLPKIVVLRAAAIETHTAALNLHEGASNKRQAKLPNRQRRSDRMVALDRGNSLLAASPHAEVTRVQKEIAAQTSRLPTGARPTPSLPLPDPTAVGTADPGNTDAEKPLRMDIQTRNPNVRIIWFSQREPKPLTTPAKGI